MTLRRTTLVALFAYAGLALPSRAHAQDAGGRPPASPGAPASSESPRENEPRTAQMAGLVDEAFLHLARTRNAEGLGALQRNDLPAALSSFKEAHDLDPENAEHTNNLAFLHFRLGNVEDAERYYRETLQQDPQRFIAHLNLADLLSAPTATTPRLREAAELLVRARELRGNDVKLVARQARIAARLGLQDEAARFYREIVDRTVPDQTLALEIGDFHRDFGQFDEALSWYKRFPGPAAERIQALEVEREARRWGLSRVTPDVPEQARALATRGRVALEAGRLAEAAQVLGLAVHAAPRFTSARGDLAEVEMQLGHLQEAERHLLLGLALDHGDPDLHLRLARLYRPTPAHPGLPDRAAESLLLLTQALQLAPDRVELNWEAALSARATGDLNEALRHVKRFLERAPPDATQRPDAEVLRASLEAALGPGHVEPTPGGADPSPFAAAINRARAFLSRGEPDAALAELSRVDGADRQPEVERLRGRILHAAGRLDEAAAAFERALDAAPEGDRTALETELGRLRAEQGRVTEAREHLLSAEDDGDAEARYALVRLDLDWLEDRGIVSLVALRRLDDVSTRLDALTADAQGPGPSAAELEGLRARLAALNESVTLVLAGLAVALLTALAAALNHRYGGRDLAILLTRHPETGPEIQRVLSAIRHEVLKHNTLMLAGLVDALARGEPAAEKAAFCRRSLLGDGAGGTSGAIDRLRDYDAQLRQIARAHGERLNLAYRDPALSALRRGFGLLRQAEGDLRAVGSLSPRRVRGLLRRLEQAAHLLNVEGYEAVRDLLDRLRVLRVDATLLSAIFDRARREPALSHVRIAAPDIVADPAVQQAVAVPRGVLTDILVNLIRNAIQSTLRHAPAGSPPQPVRIGLRLDEEVDLITGLSRAVFRVLDTSPQVLTEEMLRGRYIEAGLGLTADLVSRYEGTLSVETGDAGGGEAGGVPPPYTKSVVVKLPQVPQGVETAADGPAKPELDRAPAPFGSLP